MMALKNGHKFKTKVNLADPGKVSYSWKKSRMDSLYQDSDSMKSVIERAEEVLKSIPMEYPRFSMPMIMSNVSKSFWLILPVDFCKSFMPNEDKNVVLVDDHGEQWNTKYLTKQHGLSAGWRSFAIGQRLLKGDIVVFHMISPCIFKVNIVRVYGLDVIDGALMLMLISNSRNSTSKDRSNGRRSEKLNVPGISGSRNVERFFGDLLK